MLRGYTQPESIGYEETSSSTVKFISIYLILAIIAYLDLQLHQVKVKTTFVSRKLDKEIYMKQSIDFIIVSQKHKVCKLQRSMYVLK